MNESNRELFKKSKKFEIGSIENYLRLPAISEKIEKISEIPDFRHQNPAAEPKTVPSYRISQKSTKVF